MKTLDFIQVTISHHLKDPHSKALEPDCVSPFACDYDTVSSGGGPGWGWESPANDLYDTIGLDQGVMTKLPLLFLTALAPGSMTTVVNGDSMIAGPSINIFGLSPSKISTRVFTIPVSLK
jgi:hypothetical protein